MPTKIAKKEILSPKDIFTETIYVSPEAFLTEYKPLLDLCNDPEWIKMYGASNLYIRSKATNPFSDEMLSKNREDKQSSETLTRPDNEETFLSAFITNNTLVINDPITYGVFNGSKYLVNGNTRYSMIDYFVNGKGSSLKVKIHDIPVRGLRTEIEPSDIYKIQVQSNDTTRPHSVLEIAKAMNALKESLEVTGISSVEIKNRILSAFSYVLGTGNNALTQYNNYMGLNLLDPVISDLVVNGLLAPSTSIELSRRHKLKCKELDKEEIYNEEEHNIVKFHEFVLEWVNNIPDKSTKNKGMSLYSKDDVKACIKIWPPVEEVLVEVTETEADTSSDYCSGGQETPVNDVEQPTKPSKTPTKSREDYISDITAWSKFNPNLDNPTQRKKLFTSLLEVVSKIVKGLNKNATIIPMVDDYEEDTIKLGLALLNLYIPKSGIDCEGTDFLEIYPDDYLGDFLSSIGFDSLAAIANESNEPVVEPDTTPEPVIEPVVEPTPEPVVEPEPVIEPTPEPVAKKPIVTTDSLDFGI